jgi:L-serine dehydratase
MGNCAQTKETIESDGGVMNLFDIIGPVMVGPSSSHTAGAVRIGNVARKLVGSDIKLAKIYFHGSFQLTGKGHGTDKALLAGLMGMPVDDSRIPRSYAEADIREMAYGFFPIDLGDAHPNSVKLVLDGKNGRHREIVACSIGGGRIQITEIDGLAVSFGGDYPTIVIRNQDIPGQVQQVTTFLAEENINIGSMQLYRSQRGGDAVMVIECDKEVPEDVVGVVVLSGILLHNSGGFSLAPTCLTFSLHISFQ